MAETTDDKFADSVIQDTLEGRAELQKEWRCTELEAQIMLAILFGRADLETLNDLGMIQHGDYCRLQRQEDFWKDSEFKLALINAMPGAIGEGTFGVETINTDPSSMNHTPEAYYLNTGDSYSTTILYDTDNSRFLLTTWADFLTEVERLAMDEAEAPGRHDLTDWDGLEVDDTTKVGPGAWIVHHILDYPDDYPELASTDYVSFAYKPGIGLDYPDFCHFSLLEEVGEEWQDHFKDRPELAGLENRELPFSPKMIGFVPAQQPVSD